MGGGIERDASGLDAQLRARAAAAVAEHGAEVAADPWRQSFHVQPQVGALADPVGLVWHDGVYHLCHLLKLFEPQSPPIFWVHLSSLDLVHWSDPAIALAPSNDFDSHGCYSGSGIVQDGQVRLLYTGNVRTPDGGRTPYQCLATLQEDGTAVKHPANPLFGAIAGYTPHLRDPHVWVADGSFLMLLGAQTDDLHGSLVMLRSADLVEWELLGQVAGGADEPFGYMWECPGLVRLVDRAKPAAGARDVLIVSPQFDHGAEAGAARFEDTTYYTCGELSLDPPRLAHGQFLRFDLGPDFYAPRTLVAADGRTIVIGWMGMPVHPGEPEIGDRHPTVANGWVHCLAVPRTLELVDGRLVQWPVPELDQLHGDPVVFGDVAVASGQAVSLPGVEGACLDLYVSADPAPGAALVVGLREGPGQATLLTVDPWSGSVTLDRGTSGRGERGAVSGHLESAGSFTLRLLVDNSSVEVFVNGGRVTMSARIYPDVDATGISFAAHGGPVTLAEVTCHPMRGT
ncbi:MAG: sucrose-6-phosphate hydrolase [Candidatus Nanopelagicales bacterium]